MSVWNELKIDELCIKITDGAHHSPKEHKGGLPMFSVKDMEEQGFSYTSPKTISHDDYNKLIKGGCQPEIDDILIAKDGSVMKHVFRVKEKPDYVLLSSIAILRPNKEIIDPEFFVYTLKTPRMNYNILKNYVSGTGVPRIVLKDFKKIDISFPEMTVQKKIAKTLSNLDQKITLLREQNQTLEELAQTLFKRWFVEFEFPNENGQPYKSSGGKMVESELGEIPEGWRVGEVADFVNHSTKSVSPSKEPNKIFSHYSIPAFDSGRYPTKDVGASILSNKYEVLENSILVSKLNPSTSRIWTVFQPCENGICSTEIQVFVPNTNAYAFSFGLFHYSGIKREMAQRASGTSSSHQRVRPGDILNIEFVVPKEETLKKFEDSVLGLLKKIEDNQEEIQSLTQLRDTLLPKLMSGELRVKE